MIRAKLAISFATPAFLGNAEQQAHWRTSPFKALLRLWWLVLEWANSQENAGIGAPPTTPPASA